MSFPHPNDPIVCFSHCHRKKKILCLSFPDFCPLCLAPLRSAVESGAAGKSDKIFEGRSLSPERGDLSTASVSRDVSLPILPPVDPRLDPRLGAHSFPGSDHSAGHPTPNETLMSESWTKSSFPDPQSFQDSFTPSPVSSSPDFSLDDSEKFENQPDFPEPFCERSLHQSPLALKPPSHPDSLSLSIPPFRLPSPFRRGYNHPRHLLIRPSKGSFLHDYQMYDDLHIGITDSMGTVYDYSHGGINVRSKAWSQCLIINIPSSSSSAWDEALNLHIEQTKTSLYAEDAYDGEVNNCFDFVLDFLRSLSLNAGSEQTEEKRTQTEETRRKTREMFTKSQLLPAIERAMKYILVYRKLLQTNFWIHDES